MEDKMVFKNIVFNIQEILRQATEDNPPGDIHLHEIRDKVWDTVTPEAKREFKKAGNTLDVFYHRVRAILTHYYSERVGKMYFIKPYEYPSGKKKPIYRLDREHPKVKRWIDKKWYEKGMTIDSSYYYDD